MGTMLSDIKEAVGVDANNLGFDQELLGVINAVASGLSQVGITEFDTLVIEAETDWPVFTSVTVGGLVKPYFFMKVRSIFDPIPSETIAKTLHAAAVEFEGRMAYEVEEENAP